MAEREDMPVYRGINWYKMASEPQKWDFYSKDKFVKQRDQEVSRQQTLMATEELPNRAEDPPIVPEIGPLSPQVVPMASEVPPIVTIDSPIETKEPPIAFDDHDSNLLPQMAINLHRALPRAKKIYDDAPDSHYFLSGVTVKRDPDEPPRKMASEQIRPQPVNTFVPKRCSVPQSAKDFGQTSRFFSQTPSTSSIPDVKPRMDSIGRSSLDWLVRSSRTEDKKQFKPKFLNLFADSRK